MVCRAPPVAEKVVAQRHEIRGRTVGVLCCREMHESRVLALHRRPPPFFFCRHACAIRVEMESGVSKAGLDWSYRVACRGRRDAGRENMGMV